MTVQRNELSELTDKLTLQAEEALVSVTERYDIPESPPTIEGPEDYEQVANRLKVVTQIHRELESVRDSFVKPIGSMRSAVSGVFVTVLADTEAETRNLKRRMATYNDLVERQRKAEMHRLQAEAEAAQARLNMEAEKLRDIGRHEEADLLDMPVAAPRLPEELEAPKAQGVSTRTLWKVEVLDMMALVQAVARGEVPIGVLSVNMPFLNSMARSYRGVINIPGVRAYEDKTMAVRL